MKQLTSILCLPLQPLPAPAAPVGCKASQPRPPTQGDISIDATQRKETAPLKSLPALGGTPRFCIERNDAWIRRVSSSLKQSSNSF